MTILLCQKLSQNLSIVKGLVYQIPLVKCLNESLDNGKLSVGQRQGLIICIPKEGKAKHFLKNWRPITLLKDFNIIPKRLVQFYSKVINAR
jgi:hypothetical protein